MPSAKGYPNFAEIYSRLRGALPYFIAILFFAPGVLQLRVNRHGRTLKGKRTQWHVAHDQTKDE